MPTMAEAIREAVTAAGGHATRDAIRAHVNERYPHQWRPATLTAHLYACVVNNRKAYTHHPHAERFLYRNSDGSLEFYDEKAHGPNIWAPEVSGEEENESSDTVTAMFEAEISLERDIEDFLVRNLPALETGLTLVERQHDTEIGRLDILARDGEGRTVIIEVKAVEARDAAIGQAARYMGWFAAHGHEGVRGFLVAPDFAEGARYAALSVPRLELRRCRIHFTFESAAV